MRKSRAQKIVELIYNYSLNITPLPLTRGELIYGQNSPLKGLLCLGGHLIEVTVSGTIELCLTKTAKLTKQFDPETGLKLFIF